MIEYVEKGAFLLQEKRKWLLYIPYYDKKIFGKTKKIVKEKGNKFKNELIIVELDKETSGLLKGSGRFICSILLGFIFGSEQCNWNMEKQDEVLR